MNTDRLTDKERVLRMLKCGGMLGVSTLEFCLNRLGASYRGRISDLRREGWVIRCHSVYVDGRRHSRFVLVNQFG